MSMIKNVLIFCFPEGNEILKENIIQFSVILSTP